jgi:hypothetical protein
MEDKANITSIAWIRGGISVSLGLTFIFLLRRNWRAARITGAFAAAFAEKWRETRLARELSRLLAQAGRTP